MFKFLSQAFDTTDFQARWQCGNWSEAHGWLHILSDGAIFAAYFAIPLLLAYFVLRRQDVPFLPIFWLFAAFILCCGIGHAVEATLFWQPWYRLSGLIKLATAVVSWATVLALIPVFPKALTLPGLAAANDRLGREIDERKRLEGTLRSVNEELEQRVRERTEQLTHANERLSHEQFLLKTLVDNIPEPVFFKDRQSRFIRANRKMAHDAGCNDPAELIGKSDADIWGGAFPGETLADEQRIMETGEPLINKEEMPMRQDGPERWVSVTKMPLRDETGAITGLFGIAWDISRQKRQARELDGHRRAALNIAQDAEEARRAAEKANAELQREIGLRRQAEETLKRLAAELARSNAELEQFAYIASHDLQEPLRKVQAFGDMLASKYREALADEGRDFLQRMQSASKRMQGLINDLLALSRVITKAKPFDKVSLAEVARQVVSDLEIRIRDTGGNVDIAELPVLLADPLQMRQLLQNLIGNALKFHRQGEPPCVKVASRLLEAAANGVRSWEITVADNGIGFEEKHAQRIFAPFQRLHGRDEYEGSGMGLAICKKIVERHGGSISAHGTLGQGSTFLVRLPVVQIEGEPDHGEPDHGMRPTA